MALTGPGSHSRENLPGVHSHPAVSSPQPRLRQNASDFWLSPGPLQPSLPLNAGFCTQSSLASLSLIPAWLRTSQTHALVIHTRPDRPSLRCLRRTNLSRPQGGRLVSVHQQVHASPLFPSTNLRPSDTSSLTCLKPSIASLLPVSPGNCFHLLGNSPQCHGVSRLWSPKQQEPNIKTTNDQAWWKKAS